MNWNSGPDGWVRYENAGTGWTIALRPDAPELGISIVDAQESRDLARPIVRLMPPDIEGAENRAPFPAMSEQYFRGNDCVASLPQQPGWDAGIQLRHRVLRADTDVAVVEVVVAVQTDLLDSHPTIDVVSDHAATGISAVRTPLGRLDPVLPAEPVGPVEGLPPEGAQNGAPPLATRIEPAATDGTVVLMLAPTDRAVARRIDSDRALHYRLLAEFLEKGVIRKARFWICRWRRPVTDDQIAELYQTLVDEPLPLTP